MYVFYIMSINFKKYKAKDVFLMGDKITENLKIALSDKAFAEKIVGLDTPEEVKAAFKEKGIEISDEGIQILGSILNKMAEKSSTNLSEVDLQEIAGGITGSEVWKGFKYPFTHEGNFSSWPEGNDKEKQKGKNIGNALAGATVVVGIVGAVVGATIGIQKLSKYASEHHWWSKIKSSVGLT